MRVKKILLGFAMAALSVSATQVLAAGCPAKGAKELTGAGATFPYPLYSKMLSEYDKACGVKVNYQSIGSGGGIRQVQEQTVDFGASDGIMNEKKIKALNPSLKLPDLAIAVIHRSDGSGTTFIFTNYLSKVSAEWKDKVGFAASVNWPGDVGGKGNEGVANSVKQIPGAIGYVELAYASQNNMDWAQLQNKAKKYLDPSLDGAAAAADIANLPDDMEVMITDSPNPNAYPISGFTWLLVYENQTDPVKGDAVANLVWWMLHNGQKYATPLEYAPLKGAAVKKAEVLVKKIKVNSQVVLK